MSVINLQVDEVVRTLSPVGSAVFVVADKNVDIVRFALRSGFSDVVLDEAANLRVMYQRPGESQVRVQTMTYYGTEGLNELYDWELSNDDLKAPGTITASLCIRSEGVEEGEESKEWHTTSCQISVVDTIHIKEGES